MPIPLISCVHCGHHFYTLSEVGGRLYISCLNCQEGVPLMIAQSSQPLWRMMRGLEPYPTVPPFIQDRVDLWGQS